MASTVKERREARVEQILESAWQLASEHGIAGLSLHALAGRSGFASRRCTSTSSRNMCCTTPCSPTATVSSWHT